MNAGFAFLRMSTIRTISSSVSSPALLTLRIGIITRKYLYEEFDIQAMMEDPDLANENILEEAVVEANSRIDTIVSSYKKKEKQKA